MTSSASPLYAETMPGGGHASFVLRRGQLLRMTDLEGGANVSALMLNADEKSERLNLPDTMKGQHTARLTAGHCLYSDMGRVLAAIVTDTCGWHDTLGGLANADEVRERYGEGRYQELRNGFYRNGTDNLLVELGKWNLGLEDILMNINFFSRVDVTEDGAFRFAPGNSRAGDHVELYAPMNTLIALTALQHPCDPDRVYAPKPVRLEWFRPEDPGIAEGCRHSCPENERAFHNTERFFL
jgi:urea carboxylase-associated protein 2